MSIKVVPTQLGKIPKQPDKVMIRITERKNGETAKYHQKKFHIYGNDFDSVVKKVTKFLQDTF